MKIVDPYWPYQLIVSPGLRVAIKACVFFAIVIAAFALCGCERPPDGTAYMVAPDGTRVPMIPGHEYEFVDESDTGSSMHKYEGNAAGEGAGVTGAGEKVAAAFDASAPHVWLPGMGADGGSASIKSAVEAASASQVMRNWMFWLGVGLVFAGAALWRYGRIQTARYCLIGGGAFIVGAIYPGLIVVALLIALLVNFWPQIMAEIHRIRAEREATTKTEALRAVVAGAEDLPEPERKLLKAKVAMHADAQDRETIREIKKADDLPSERA